LQHLEIAQQLELYQVENKRLKEQVASHSQVTASKDEAIEAMND